MEIGPILRTMMRNKTGVGLLIFEIAITMAIVLNAWMLVDDSKKRLKISSGLDEENIISVTVRSFGDKFDDMVFFNQIVDQDLLAMNSLSEAISASSVSPTPLQGGGSSTLRGPAGGDPSSMVRCPRYNVDEGFIETMGLTLLEGRTFTAQDLPPADETNMPDAEDMPPRPVIVTQDLALALFPDGNALGQHLAYSGGEGTDIIVGIVKYMFTPYDNGKSGMETRILFLPARRGGASGYEYLVRAEPGTMSSLLAQLETTLLKVESDRLVELAPLTEIKRAGFSFTYFIVNVLTVIMFLLVAVTALGIFGLTSFSVAGRTKQIGTRRALGATKLQIVRYFLVENSLMTLMGITLGAVMAVALNGVIVKATDGTPLGVGAIVAGVAALWAVGLFSSLLPSLRAANVPPVVATRAT